MTSSSVQAIKDMITSKFFVEHKKGVDILVRSCLSTRIQCELAYFFVMSCLHQGAVDAYLSYVFSTNHRTEWARAVAGEDLNIDRRFKIIGVSDKNAMNADGDGNDERSATFARLLGVRDGSSREATDDEIKEVAKHTYLYFVNGYEEKFAAGFWKRWNEENDFPRCPFQSHSKRGDDDGVFDGFGVNAWAAECLINGFNGINAVQLDDEGEKTSKWTSRRCGSGLKKELVDAIFAYLDQPSGVHSELSISDRKKKKKNILNDIHLFISRRKGWVWSEQVHLFGKENIKGHYGKKISGDLCILKLKPNATTD